jgi:hypothetical protein
MNCTADRTAARLSVVIALLMAGAAALGLTVDGLCRDNALVTASRHGTDLVSLVVVGPRPCSPPSARTRT